VASSLSTVNPEDRLFHLILALMATSQGLTKDQILTTVRGYREDTEAGMARESIERRFERDKDSLRELGIPLEALIPPEEDGNNKSTLYRIPKGDYDLPEDVVFSSRDIALLNLAAAVWREGSLSRDAKTAQIKLASLGALVDETLLGFAPILSTREPALATLREAIDKSIQVSFSYLKPGDTTAAIRTISPWALVNHEGRWHVMGHDSLSNKERTFLLRRIVSTVSTLASTPAIQGPDGIADRALAELKEVYDKNTATLQVKAGTDAASALRARAGTESREGALIAHFTDAAVFANELTSWGSDVVVLDPPELRNQVIAHLEALVRAHG
jgi:proteasome accessory factor B